ncbi:JAB domain-containing protein [Aquisediminimonas sediminicola]|uniref:JAB domain-containing protein n=1 Tax=Alteraquisediminimonas sediminicola TaxID=2676787 RepID=UPI001C8E05C9|nr:JAB domain-containing protein [Aquisediminimonas sediminicola]
MSKVAFELPTAHALHDGQHNWLASAAGLARASEEYAHIYFLGSGERLIGGWRLSDGLANAVSFNTPLILRHGLLIGARQLALAHNHPSGDPRPSIADIELTRQLVRGCHALALQLVDHVILSRTGDYSMKLAGQL